MTVRLTINTSEWHRHISDVAASIDGLVPVVKGNGYGFGRAMLHPLAANVANDVCVGTVHELDHVADGMTAVVLTPTLTAPDDTSPVLTIGSTAHVAALRGWRGRVLIKLESSMHRFGVSTDDMRALHDRATRVGLDVVGVSMHLPMVGGDAARLGEIEQWLPHLDSGLPMWLSHLTPDSFGALQQRHPSRTFLLRMGTALWHGPKTFLHLSADVIDTRLALAGSTAGYRHVAVPATGHIVLVGAGSAHGVASLPDGSSPFHFARQRLALLEAPHMHTSMCFADASMSSPMPGERVDLQRPLIVTTVDEFEWNE